MDDLTQRIQRKYDRFARFYGLMETPMSWRGFNKWRQEIWREARGHVLEVGVGTGANIPYYPEGATVTAIDFSPRMLARARENAARSGKKADLRLMDAQEMDFADNSFDTVMTTCVFCTVPDPVRGLKEVHRVCRSGGRVLLLEHVRSCRPMVGKVMDWLNPIPYGLVGTSINRDTVGNIEKAGLRVVRVDKLWGDIFLKITAETNK